MSTFRSALAVFKMTADRYPTTEEDLAALVSRPDTIAPEKYEATLRREILDPWDNPYRYVFPPVHNTDEPDISSAGPDMIFDTEDDIVNWEVE